MNRLFLLVAFLVLGKISYSQYPLTQNLGSDSTIVVSKGALQSRLIPIVVSDTNAANAQRMKSYPGAQLFTTNGNFYYRNSTATKWILVSSGSAGPVNIYNTDGTLTGNRTLTGAGNSLYFDGISGLGINTLYDSLLTVDGGIHATGGLRVEKLTTSPGTKALRIDGQGVVSVADTSGGTVTSIATNNGTGITGGTITSTGTLAIDTTIISTRAWRQKGIDSVAALPKVTSVGLTMPIAFNVAGSPVTSSGTLAVTAAGLSTQYIRGDGQLANFPGGGGGGGSSVVYYFNGGTNQGTFVGNTYYEMSKTAIVGTAANFTINADGYITQFITDAGDPALLNIPAGNWNFEMYFSASSGGGSPSFYVELYKYDGTTFTLISSSSSSPEGITGGTATDLYLTALAVPATSLTLTDRLAVRVYVTHSGRTITLHTQDNTLCQVTTTFTTGITALNGLTDQVQYFATGTSGTDFNISSASATHTFNLPTASATNRGALSSSDWTTFNSKISPSDTASMLAPYLRKADTTAMLANYVNNVGYGLSKAGQVVSADSSTLANYFLRRKDSLTSTNLLGYVTRTVLADTAAAIRASAGTIGGSGTTNRVSKFTAAGTIGNSSIEDSSASVAMTIRSNGNVGIGIAAPDSMFAVSQGSLFQRGVRMSGLPSAPGTKALRIDANGTLSVADTTTGGGGGTIGGSGTTNYLPKFTASTTLGDSRLFDNGTVTFLGNGDVNATPSTGIFSGTGGTGTNIAGAELRLRGGASTGNAAGGIISFYTSAAGSSGTGVNAATERMRLDASGNLGLGVTPSAWGAVLKAFDIGTSGSLVSSTSGAGGLSVARNGYYNGSVWVYKNTSTAQFYEQDAGQHAWYTAPSGTAGNTISFTQVMTLTASGNLGIGTTTIGSRLQVNGNAAIGYSASTAAPTNGLAVSGDIQLSTDNFVYGNSTLGNTTKRAGIRFNSTLQELKFFTQDFGRFLISSSGTIFVGSDETSATPSTGIISGTGGTGTNIAGAEFRIRGGASTGSGAGGPITFYTSAAGTSGTGVNAATERMRITNTGTVGIGTTTIGSTLQVNGNAAIGYSASRAASTNGLAIAGNLNVGTGWTTQDGWIEVGTERTGNGFGYIDITTDATYTDYGLRIIRGNTGANAASSITARGTGGISIITEEAGSINFNTTNTERARILSGGGLIIGNGETAASPSTGIISGTGGSGTNIAGAEFRIRGGASTGNAAGGPITFYTSAAGAAGTGANAGAERARIDASGNLEIANGTLFVNASSGTAYSSRISTGLSFPNVDTYFDSNGGTSWTGRISFRTSTNGGALGTRMMILNNGNVGIGTTTIGSTLQVNGGAAIGYSASTAAPTNGLAVSGNVGIGISNPSANLALSGTGSIGIRIKAGSATNNVAYIDLSNTDSGNPLGAIAHNNTSGDLYFSTGGNTRRMGISNTGLVGINTPTPTGRLHVDPDDNEIGLNVSTSSLTGSNAQSLIDLAQTWNTTGNPTAIKLNITNTASGATALLMDLQVGGTPEFRVTKSGNVVVNGSTSTYQMHVVGTGSLLALGEESFTTGKQMLFGIDASGNGEIQSVQQGTSYRNLALSPLGGTVTIGTTTAAGMFTIDPVDNQVGLAITGTSLTSANAQSLIDLTQTWNTTGNPTAIKLNITNTASGASAYLMDLQVGGTTQFRVAKDGAIRTTAPTGGTADNWKFGTKVASSVVFDDNDYLEVEVGGTLYRVALVNLAEPEPDPEPLTTPDDRIFREPVRVKAISQSDNQKIKDLEKELAELKEMIKSIKK